ncbi:uncharacterized protein LOC132293317 [Cornus florida]|uniref:uncharacterized protein LOC132293317 n=1 Tax=Cornus florida TaxID=4283 RepID=UPI0028998642|nr:uncharacterized protein LOC132293317 [Cornus florida]
MMAHKNLHDLLQEDQEPFLLKDYIADRRCQINTPIPKTTLQLKKRKSIVETSNSRGNILCKQACFLSNFLDSPSPDVRKSPFLDFPSPAKSPYRTPNTVILHVPSRTAALLLEAAMRIQKQSSSPKPKTQIKNLGFGLLGSILKRLSSRNRTRKREIGGGWGGGGASVSMSGGRRKSTGKSEKMQESVVDVNEKSASEMGRSCYCNHSRRNSTVWSESNEEKSLDLESSSSCRSEDSEELEFVCQDRANADFDSCEKRFCSTPFLFSLQKSPSSGHRTPDFCSPATSPSRHKIEDKEKYEAQMMQKSQEHVEEEEKEQCSPVSVLDPPFEDDNKEHEGGDEEDGYDLECSYAVIQRAKQHLLHKLRRFEKLAGLDPIELEKKMLEEQDDEVEEEWEDDDEAEALSLCREENVNGLLREVLGKSSHHHSKLSADMNRLVLDLIAEEEREQDDSEVVVKKVCKRLDSWKEVESNTIDMMVELDFRREVDGWKKNQEEVRETAMEIELAILGLLMEELSVELVC